MTGLGETSQFWGALSSEHARMLESRSIATFKRSVALRYFTWQWHWRTVADSEQARFLLRHSSLLALWRAFREPLDLGDAAWSGVNWSRADRRLYAAATRLLWGYASRHGDGAVLALPEPEIGSPFPVPSRGRLISQDLANSALETSTMLAALDGHSPQHVLEIGAGYGRNAYALLHCFPAARYTIIDIDPARSLARWYLTQLFPSERVTFVKPDDADCLATGAFDLAVSISSLQELVPEQADRYVRLLDRVTSGGVVYLKQWHRWFNPVDRVEFRFDQLPVPHRWSPVIRRRCRVQTRLEEAAWQVSE